MRVFCKFLAEMPRRVVLFALFSLFTVSNSAAQVGKVAFSSQSMTIKEALSEIEVKTGYMISMTHKKFDVSKRVTFPSSMMDVKDALDIILKQSGRSYIVEDKHILVVPPRYIQNPIPEYKPSVDSVKPAQEQEQEVKTYFEERANVLSPDKSLIIEPSSDPLVLPFIPGVPALKRNLPQLAIKTNFLYAGLALAPNLGVEVGLNNHSTIELWGAYNGWNLDGTPSNNKKLAHWIGQLEYRHWFCERFNGHFIGFHGFYSMYNIGGHKIPLLLESDSDQYRYKGNMMGLGVSYGYQLMLGKKWNLEFNLGIGYGLMKYDKFNCPRCGDVIDKDVAKHYFGPTKAGISLVYLIK